MLAHSTGVQDICPTNPTYRALLHKLLKYLQVSILLSEFNDHRPGFSLFPPQLLHSSASCTMNIGENQVACEEMPCHNYLPCYPVHCMAEGSTESLILAQTSLMREHSDPCPLYIFQFVSLCTIFCDTDLHTHQWCGRGIEGQPPFGLAPSTEVQVWVPLGYKCASALEYECHRQGNDGVTDETKYQRLNRSTDVCQ